MNATRRRIAMALLAALGAAALSAADEGMLVSPVARAAPQRLSPFSGATPPATGTSPFSLWSGQGDGRIHPLYQTGVRPRRRIAEGDIIHVMVDESSFATITANTDMRRRFEVDAELRDWVHLNGATQLVPDEGVRATQPGVDFRSERRMQGNGRRDRRDTMQFRIAAQVAWDLGDGTLFITAKKLKRIHDETSILTLSGYVRREDIDENRMVRSEKIFDLDLAYTGSGSLTSNYTRSIWGWLLDLIWF